MSVDEPSIQESAESGQSAVRVVSGYSATRRTARKHKRVVRQGTELFDADGVKLEPSDVLTERQRNADDDKRIQTSRISYIPHDGAADSLGNAVTNR